MKILILLTIIYITKAQFPLHSIPDIPGVTPKPWTGPLASHQIGIHPGDTPEVAAAKAQHLKAFHDVLAVLPELPPEERYQKTGLPLPAVLALQKQAHEQLGHVQHVQPVYHHTEQPIVVPHFQHTGEVQHRTFETEIPSVLAEEIPRSPIGEVPEVHAARVAHLKAVEEARAALPPLAI